MNDNNLSYPILDPKDLVPREQIQLVPETDLEQFMRDDLVNLRRGVPYKIVVADTTKNRNAISYNTAYFQMVAYKEGWKFNPENYQVEFVAPNSLMLEEPHFEKRVFMFKKGSKKIINGRELSPQGNLGVRIDKKRGLVVVMGGSESDSLVTKVSKLFRK